ncbi:probable DEAD-box ATP-dependent RNA helicase 48 [Gastrolobium bilobum]|uniref:probable DEAD-box ATP-dependent RNA helicase 48 n=1 Tax=Gastrolobium bilobum TaxID=150636 RepID=UPI002AAFB71D|nr:probable DEAD-box ATP-dependent RNA helicase 48 [Gastrolobium bilobum]
MNILNPNLPQQVSFSKSLSSSQWHFLHNNSNNLSSLTRPSTMTTIIRMGGGPRTYPGGVSKWQWKRMQAKKAKQLLKARLMRERQIYEMRKRAELKAAVSELERPWEVVEKAPSLFSVSADEQVKVLADRFQRPGGFDLWSENDGPQLFETPDDLPSARFFPKGVVHSIKPYRKVGGDGDELMKGPVVEDDWSGDADGRGFCSDSDSGVDGVSFDSRKGNGRKFLSNGVGRSNDGERSSSLNYDGRKGFNVDGKMRKNGNGSKFFSKGVDGSDDGERSSSSSLGSGRKGFNVDGKMRKNGNGSKFFTKGVDGSDDGERSSSSSLGSGRNGVSFDGRSRNKGNGRRYLSNNVDGSDDRRLRSKGDGRRVMPKDFDGSNGLYSGRVGSGMIHRGSNSIAGRRSGKYTKRTSGNASRRVREADSEVYDMGLEQDGSYGFLQESE